MKDFHANNVGPEQRLSRDRLKKLLKVVKGGKFTSSNTAFVSDGPGLNDDPFLREHYLEGRHKRDQARPSWMYFLMGDAMDLPPEAG